MRATSAWTRALEHLLAFGRYLSATSDRVEMWSHVFIFVGHLTMMGAWWVWLLAGSPGVAETLS